MRRAVVVLLALSAPVLAASFRPFAGMRGDTVPAWTTPQGSASEPDPTFDMFAGATTPNDLPDTLTVNSVSMTLVLACDAQSISGTSWTCRDANGAVTLSEAGTGASPASSILTPFHALDSAERGAVYTSTGKVHAAASSTVADVSTEDMAVEFVYKGTTANNGRLIDKGILGTDGWSLRQSSASNSLAFELRTASTTTAVSSASTAAGQLYHGLVFADRDEATTNGAIFYLNGGAGAGVSVSARTGSLANATTLNVGGVSSAAAALGPISSIRVWKCAACMAGGATNPTQWAPIARQRAATAFGVSPIIARGAAAPTTLTRATTAHVDVVDGNTRQLYLVGNNAPRVARRTSQGSPIAGYLSEPAVSNIALQSQTLGTTWAAITVGDNVLADAYAGADLTVTGDNIDGNNSNAEHGLRQSITVTAAPHTFSAWAKTGTQNFVALRNATIANGTAWFDVATCTSSSCTIGEDCASAVGTVQAGVTRASAERYPVDTTGDGVADVNLCRVAITYTGTAAAHNHDLLCAPSNGNLVYTDADATADCGFWGVRVEAFPAPTSYLATTTASTARNADDLRFDGASHYTGSPSTMDVVTLCPNVDFTSVANVLSVGVSGTDFFMLRTLSSGSDRRANTGGAPSQWDITAPSGDFYNGLYHSMRVAAATNNITLYADSVPSGTDTLATMPTVASSIIYFGGIPGTVSPPSCLINRARLWSSLVTP